MSVVFILRLTEVALGAINHSDLQSFFNDSLVAFLELWKFAMWASSLCLITSFQSSFNMMFPMRRTTIVREAQFLNPYIPRRIYWCIFSSVVVRSSATSGLTLVFAYLTINSSSGGLISTGPSEDSHLCGLVSLYSCITAVVHFGCLSLLAMAPMPKVDFCYSHRELQ